MLLVFWCVSGGCPVSVLLLWLHGPVSSAGRSSGWFVFVVRAVLPPITYSSHVSVLTVKMDKGTTKVVGRVHIRRNTLYCR